MKRIFHVDLDAFFVAVERAHDPSLAGKPVVVGGKANSRGVVTCASYEARPFGLHAGMPLSQAYRLCPGAIYLPGRYDRYAEASLGFHRLLGSYTPSVEPLGMDEAFMDMTGFEELYGPMRGVASEIKNRVRDELGLTASVGIAASKVTAKVASESGKPDGLVEVPIGGDAEFLAPLPVRELPGVGEKTAETLREVFGVTTVGELAQAQTPELRRAFGARADLLRLWARGEDHSPVQGFGPAKSIGRETTFEKESRDPEFLLGTLQYLCERVGGELRREGKAARRVSVKARFSDFKTVSHQTTFKAPIAHDYAIQDAAKTLLLRTLDARPLALRLVGVSVSDLSDSAAQMALFNQATRTPSPYRRPSTGFGTATASGRCRRAAPCGWAANGPETAATFA